MLQILTVYKSQVPLKFLYSLLSSNLLMGLHSLLFLYLYLFIYLFIYYILLNPYFYFHSVFLLQIPSPFRSILIFFFQRSSSTFSCSVPQLFYAIFILLVIHSSLSRPFSASFFFLLSAASSNLIYLQKSHNLSNQHNQFRFQ